MNHTLIQVKGELYKLVGCVMKLKKIKISIMHIGKEIFIVRSS